MADEARALPSRVRAQPPGAAGVPVAVLRLGFLALLLLLWWLAARAAPPALFASPLAVAEALVGLAASGRLSHR